MLTHLSRSGATGTSGQSTNENSYTIKNQYPVPTYVVEFLLGRYCASVDEQEIQDGLQIVQRQL